MDPALWELAGEMGETPNLDLERNEKIRDQWVEEECASRGRVRGLQPAVGVAARACAGDLQKKEKNL